MTFSVRYLRVTSLIGWARSWCWPSGRLRLGIATNSPEFPRITLSPRMTNESLSVMLTKALSFSSFLSETRTSVISIMVSPRSHPWGKRSSRGYPSVGDLCGTQAVLAHLPALEFLFGSEPHARSGRVHEVQRFCAAEAIRHGARGTARFENAEHCGTASGQLRPRHSRVEHSLTQRLERVPFRSQHGFEAIAGRERPIERYSLMRNALSES